MKRVIKATESFVDIDTVKEDVGGMVYNDLRYRLNQLVDSYRPEDIARRIDGYNPDFASEFNEFAYPKFDTICSKLTDIIVDVLCKNAEY